MDASQLRTLAKEYAKSQATIEYLNTELTAAKEGAEKARVEMVEALRNDDSVRAITIDAARVMLVKRSHEGADPEIDLEMIPCL